MLNGLQTCNSWSLPELVPAPEQPIGLLTGDNWAPTICSAIRGAQDTILLAAYALSTAWPKHWAADYSVFHALLDAGLRKLRCYAILATHPASSRTKNFNRAAALQLQHAGWSVRGAPANKLLHAKVLVIDSQLVFIGSHNLSLANATKNIDLSVRLEGRQTAVPFARFIRDLRTNSGN